MATYTPVTDHMFREHEEQYEDKYLQFSPIHREATPVIHWPTSEATPVDYDGGYLDIPAPGEFVGPPTEFEYRMDCMAYEWEYGRM